MPSSDAPRADHSRPQFNSRLDGEGRVRIYATDNPLHQWIAANPSHTLDLEEEA